MEKESFLEKVSADTSKEPGTQPGPSRNNVTSGKSSDKSSPSDPHVTIHQPGMGRYSQALKTLLPVRCGKTPSSQLPLDNNGFLNYMSFSWLSPLMWRVYRRGAGELTHLRLRDKDSAQVCAQKMESLWQQEVATRGIEGASFGRVMFQAFRTRVIIGIFASVLSALLILANPVFVIRYFLEYLQRGQVDVSSGIIYAVLLGLVVLVHGLTGGFFWMLNFEAATRIKYGSLALLYRKVLRIKHLKDKTVGELVNFISNDGQRIWDAIIMGPFAAGAPVVLVLSLVYSLMLLGPWALVGWFVTIAYMPVAGMLAHKSMKFREISIKLTDTRVSFINEILTNIKLIKMYAWEECFSKKVYATRASEQQVLAKSVFAQSVAMGSGMLVPIMAACLTFVAYVSQGNHLNPMEAFTFVSLLNTLQSSLMAVPFSLKSIAEASVTITRMKEILLLEEISEVRDQVSNSDLAVEVTNASCTWTPRGGKQEPKKELSSNGKTKDKKKKNKKGLPSVASEEQQTMTSALEEEHRQIFTAPVLRNISFSVKKGQLLGVCGHIGCGKSSLITALLGRMDMTSGSVAVSGRIAYVAQQAWITNDTIRNNILFGHNYDQTRYKAVLEACALRQDIDAMAGGDTTEVGERGATLSGGQRQRISLARAAYSSSDLVLLDDPLSAVDVQIGHHIFEHCVTGLLKERTVVLVTHQLQYLKHCSSVIVMKEGHIIESGNHVELMAHGGEYASLLKLYHDKSHSREESKSSGGDGPINTDKKSSGDHSTTNGGLLSGDGNNSHPLNGHHISDRDPILKENGDTDAVERVIENHLTEEEEMEGGALSKDILGSYIQAMGGCAVFVLVLLCFCLPVAGITTAGWYLSHWLSIGGGGIMTRVDNQTVFIEHPDQDYYLIIYVIFIPVLIIFMLMRSISITKAVLAASTSLHNQAFANVLRCPAAFFDATPLGRLVNRFSADLDEIDMRLPMNAEIFISSVLQIVAALGMIAYVSPWFLVAIVPFGALFFFLMVMFHSCVTAMKRLDNVTRSPILSHMGASVQGLATIQAYQVTEQFAQHHCQLLDKNSVPVFLFYCANRWLAVRMDVLSAAIAFLTGLLVILTFDLMNPALAGLAISYSVQMSGLFQFTARLFIEVEARFTSVQRILQYCNLTSVESSSSSSSSSRDVPSEWPAKGSIRFDKVSLRYREELPLALREIQLDINAREKIGIVGRTAAGKSSLAVALFRLTELEQGHIYIDDLDISTIDLKVLRSRISIIPQEPVLFAGSIRYNMDPLTVHSDSEIWEALAKCHIQELVKLSDQQLDTTVQEAGVNFSLGERQLLCLARALLKGSQILLLDEATAAIDTETDTLIQNTLTQAFSHCTILTIAHRLHTVTRCDRILLMKNGQVQEFDTPANLLADPHSEFKAMLDAGEQINH